MYTKFTNAFIKSTTTVMLLFVLFFSAKAQNITYPVAAQDLTRGYDSSWFDVKVAFPTACTAGSTITVYLGQGQGAAGQIQYRPGSLTVVNSPFGLTIAEGNISNLNQPQFTVSTNTVGQTIEFKILRRANCGAQTATKDSVAVTNCSGGSFSDVSATTNNYNLKAPALTLVPPALITNTDLGVAYNRTFTVTNGGTGCLDTMGIWVKYPTGSATLNSLKLGTTILTALYSSADSSYFQVPGIFCNGSSSYTFTENVTFKKCNFNTTYGTDWYPFTSSTSGCSPTISTTNIAMSNNLPNVIISLPKPNRNYCPNGTFVNDTLRVVNTGAGAATNILVSYRGWYPGGFASFSFTDTTNWLLLNKSYTVLGNMIKTADSHPKKVYSGYDATCTANTAWFDDSVKMTFPNFVLAAGDTAYIVFRDYFNNVACTPMHCWGDYYFFDDVQIGSSYQDQCGNNTHTQILTDLYNSNIDRAQYNIQAPPDVILNTQFKLNINYSSLISLANKSINGKSYIFFKLPNGITLNGPIASTLVNAAYPSTLSYIQSNDTLFIPIINNSNAWGIITLPLIAGPAACGNQTFIMGHLHWYDSTNCPSSVLSLACSNYTIDVHCPAPCPPGGATPLSFNLQRITYGYPDNNNDNVPDALTGLPDLTKINTNNAIEGDTTLGTWIIKVYSNTDVTDVNVGNAFNHLYIDFPLISNAGYYPSLSNQPYKYNPVPNAVASIYTNGVFVSNCTVTPTIINGIAHYDFSNCKATWNGGDSLIVNAKFIIGGATSSGGYYHALTSAQVYSTYAVQATPTIAAIANTTYTCDHFQSYQDILYTAGGYYNYNPQYISGCSNRNLVTLWSYQFVDNGAAIKFPYESRIPVLPDTVIIDLPAGYTYQANTAYMTNVLANSISINPFYIPSANVVVSGNYLKFVNLKSLFNVYGGTLSTVETPYISFNYSVTATCAVAPGSVENYTAIGVNAGNGINFPTEFYSSHPWQIGSQVADSTTNTVTYNAPMPNLTGGGTVQSTTGTGTWQVVLQNGSNSLDAPNSWFYFTPTGSLTNITVTGPSGAITPDANGFYRLGNNVASGNVTYTITAKTNSCSLDSMQINEGYDCLAYPTTFGIQSCQKTTWLKLDNYPSQIQLSITQQPNLPGGTVSLCALDSVIFSINSALAGFAANPMFLIAPPTGVTFVNAYIEWPMGSGNWQLVSPTVGGGVDTFKVLSHTALATAYPIGLPGVVDYPAADKRAAQLKIVFGTDCNFTSGATITARQVANRPCGQAIPTNLGYNNGVNSNPISIAGATSSTTASFNLSLSPATVSCGITTISGTITPVGGPTANTDTVLVTLPAGITYAGNFTNPVNCSYVGTSAGPIGSTIVAIKLTAGLPSGFSAGYSFDLNVSPSAGCGNFNILSQLKRTGTPLTCTPPSPAIAYTCPNNSNVILGASSNTTIVLRPKVVIPSVTLLSGLLRPGNTVVFNVVVQDTSATQSVSANSLQVNFYCGTTLISTQPFAPAIASNSLANSNFSLSIPSSPTCSNGNVIKVAIVPAASSCVCDSTGYTYTATALPVDIISFTATPQATLVQLNWQVASQVNVSYYEILSGTSLSNMQSIGKVSAVANSSNYTFSDANPSIGVNYYRLKIVDNGGLVSYSEIKIVNFGKGSNIIVYPNPAKDNINITVMGSMVNKPATIGVFAADGKAILQKQIASVSPTETLNVSRFASGKYLIRMVTDTEVITKVIEIVK